jgi:hypothetical protein
MEDMMKRIATLALTLALLVGTAWTEPYYVSISATTTAATSFFGKPGATVLACNDGTGIAYARLFTELETPAAATSANNQIPVGACISWTKGPTEPAYWDAINVLSASTSTVRVYVN